MFSKSQGHREWTLRTETGCEQCHIQIGHELLLVLIEHPLLGNNVSRQAHTNNFQDCFEDQEDKVAQSRMRSMVVLPLHDAEPQLESLRHDGRAIVIGSDRIQTVRGWDGEECHRPEMEMVFTSNLCAG